ncbi:MAG: hypothetical protein HY089_09600, partial [Ignavibacteriales bacterium]|nr:hypothetical protein [Ignavibacteriales bacterium]
MKLILLCVLILMTESLLAQSPVEKTYAYSRHTTPGIPEDTIREAPRKPLLT